MNTPEYLFCPTASLQQWKQHFILHSFSTLTRVYCLKVFLIKFPDLFSYNYILSMDPVMHLNILATLVTPSCVQLSCVFSDYFSVYICKDNLSIWMVFLPCESARGFSAKHEILFYFVGQNKITFILWYIPRFFHNICKQQLWTFDLYV